jgi:hypothetical protein
MKRSFPRSPLNHRTAEAGINAVARIVNDDFGCIFRRTHGEHDFGLDGYIDIVTEDGSVTGQCLAAQVKSGESYFQIANAAGFVFYVEEAHLNYYVNCPMPVIVVLHDDRTGKCYWEHFALHRTERAKNRWKMTIPRSNELGRQTKDDIFELVGPVIRHDEITDSHADLSKVLGEADFIHYAVDREDIEAQNITHIRDFFRRLSSSDELCLRFQGRLELSVSGYDDDPRELWEISDVKKWFRKANSKIDDWFFFLNSKIPGFGLKIFFACLCDAKWRNPPTRGALGGMTELEKDALISVLKVNWSRLNRMTDHLGMSEQENKRISYEILDGIGFPHGD